MAGGKYGSLTGHKSVVEKFGEDFNLGKEAYNFLENDFKDDGVIDITQYPDDIQEEIKNSITNNSEELLGGENAEFKEAPSQEVLKDGKWAADTYVEDVTFFQTIVNTFNPLGEFLSDKIFTDDNKGSKTNVWSSFYGSQAKHTRDHLSHLLFGSGKGPFKGFGTFDRDDRTNDAKRYEGSSKIKDWMNKRTSKTKAINDKLKQNSKIWQKLNNGNTYRVGQNWKYGSVSLANFKIGGIEDEFMQLIDFGEKGKTPGYVDLSLGHYKVEASAVMGPGYVAVSGSAEVSLVHLETGVSGAMTTNFLGNDLTLLGGSANVTADLCKAYAKGKAGFGVYKDENGKTHIDAGIQGEFGVELCSAQASGSVTLLGTDIGVTGKVKVGVGLQINAGLEDGKFNFHVGAALGVGFEFGFSLDVSGTVECVADAAGNLVKGVAKGLDGLATGAKKIGKCASEAGKKLGKAAKSCAKKVWKAITSW